MMDFKQLLKLNLSEEDYARIQDVPTDLLIPLYPEILKLGPNATHIQNLVTDLKATLETKDLEFWEHQAAKNFNLKKMKYVEHLYHIALPYPFRDGLEESNQEVKDDCELILKELINMALIIIFTDPFDFAILESDTRFAPKPERYFAFFGLNLEDYNYKGEKMGVRPGEFPTLDLVY